MKNLLYMHKAVPVLLVLALFLLPNISVAQTDSTQVVQPDTVAQGTIVQDTVPQDTVAQEIAQESDNTKEKKDKKKKKNSFKVYGGANINTLSFSNDFIQSNSDVGFQLGASYKSGGFFYWEIGARYNNPYYDISARDTSFAFGGSFGVSQIDIPATVGINFLSATARLVGLRVFVSAVPSFVIGVSENDTNVSKNDLNSFGFWGAGGIGVDVAFFFLETGYQYGITDLFENVEGSNPGQFFVNLGFRF